MNITMPLEEFNAMILAGVAEADKTQDLEMLDFLWSILQNSKLV